MKISIVGTGNSGCAHAAKLVENGHSVNLIKTSDSIHNDNFDTIQANGGLHCIDSTNGDKRFFAKLNLITRDIELGLKDVDIVMILTQSLQHRELAIRISPFFKPAQIVLIIPGNLGSLQFAKYAHSKDVIFVEGESTPYDARIIEPGVVNILFKNVRNAISFLNVNSEIDKHAYLKVLDKLFGTYKYLRNNIVESAMNNPNLIVHTVGTIMSANRIEYSKGEFWMYREAFSSSIWHLIKELDNEKKSVINIYGGDGVSYLDACKWRNELDLSLDSIDVFNSYAANGAPKGPSSLDTRFLDEDVPMGLCLLELLAKRVNIETPMTSSLINIASSMKQQNYREISYTLDDIEFMFV